MRSAMGDRIIMIWHHSTTVSSSSASGTTLFTMPMSNAS